jgi:hypothetical protein
LLTQGDLIDLVRDLNLSKQQAELLGSSLKGCNLLHQDNKKCFFRNRQNELEELFSQENNLVFCIDVCCFLEALGHQDDPNEWRFFIDSSNVLFYTTEINSLLSSVPPAHLADMQESNENMNLFRKRSSMKNITGIFVGN